MVRPMAAANSLLHRRASASFVGSEAPWASPHAPLTQASLTEIQATLSTPLVASASSASFCTEICPHYNILYSTNISFTKHFPFFTNLRLVTTLWVTLIETPTLFRVLPSFSGQCEPSTAVGRRKFIVPQILTHNRHNPTSFFGL
jgi:hypothetical protein